MFLRLGFGSFRRFGFYELGTLLQDVLNGPFRDLVNPADVLFFFVEFFLQGPDLLFELLVEFLFLFFGLVFAGGSFLGNIGFDIELQIIDITLFGFADLDGVMEVVEGINMDSDRMIQPGLFRIGIYNYVVEAGIGKGAANSGNFGGVEFLVGAGIGQLEFRGFRIPDEFPGIGRIIRPFQGNGFDLLNTEPCFIQPLIRMGKDVAKGFVD